MRYAMLVAIGLLLTACATRQEELNKQMDTWLGHPIAEYALRFGPPLGTFEMGNGRRAFQWQSNGQTPGVAVPINGMMIYRPPQQTSCMISFVASTSAASPSLSDWIIREWSYQGNC
jgi:hypothetical protein